MRPQQPKQVKPRKIAINFLDQHRGYVELSADGKLKWSGNCGSLRDEYGNCPDEEVPDELLKHLRGMWWAAEVPVDEAPQGG